MPFLVQWKGKLPAGKVYDQPVIQLDILPTALAAAGVEVEARVEARRRQPAAVPAAARRPTPPHDALYWRFGGQMAIRKGDWKLVKAPDGPGPAAAPAHGREKATVRGPAVQPEGRHRRADRPGGEAPGEGEGAGRRLAEVERRTGRAALVRQPPASPAERQIR